MTGVSKEYGGGLDPGTSGMMETTMMEGEEFYTPETAANADAAAGGDWPGKIPTSQLCRVCANPNEYLIPIFEGEGLEHELGTKIQKHLPIEVTESDTLPLHMCYNCASTLIAWNDMVVGCVEADKKLRQLQQEEENEEDYDDKAVFYDTPAIDSDTADDPIEPSTSAAPARGKRTVKEKKPRLRPPAKAAAASKSRLSSPPKAQEDASAGDSANERSDEDQDVISRMLAGSPSTKLEPVILDQEPAIEVTVTQDETVEEDLPQDDFVYRCVLCDRLITGINELQKHIDKMHGEDRRHVCIQCGRSFRDKKGLSRHEKDVHENIRPHACDLCDKSFTTRYSRDNHRRCHTGERPYVCHICGKRMKTRGHFNSHSATHNAATLRFQCSQCGKRFRRHPDYLNHRRSHSGDKPHACDVCGLRFATHVAVTRHKNVHLGFRAFVCIVCGVNFSQKKYLLAHEQTVHKDVEIVDEILDCEENL